jgi:hypothetical protein
MTPKFILAVYDIGTNVSLLPSMNSAIHSSPSGGKLAVEDEGCPWGAVAAWEIAREGHELEIH